ncbi:hypothetical protein [Marinomonas sp.]
MDNHNLLCFNGQNENSLKNLRYLQKVFRVSLKADPLLVISINQADLVGSALAEGGIDSNHTIKRFPQISSVTSANEKLTLSSI